MNRAYRVLLGEWISSVKFNRIKCAWMGSSGLATGSLTLLSCVGVKSPLSTMVLKGGLFCCLCKSETENRKPERNLRFQVNPELQKPFVTDRKGHVLIISI